MTLPIPYTQSTREKRLEPARFEDEFAPAGYVPQVSCAFRESLQTIAKRAVIAGYERGSLTEDQATVYLFEFALGAE